jgi:hypothetical protein
MRQGLVDIDWELAGAMLANEGSDEQTKFFKSFVKECLDWGTKHQVQVQLASVNHDLTESEKDILSMLGYEGD